MGWTSMKKPYDIKEYFKSGWGEHKEVLDIAMVRRAVVYMAVRFNDGKENYVFAAIYKISFNPKATDGYDFSYKDMSESVGPYECDCPLRIMKLLTPLEERTDHLGYSADWRERVHKYWETQKQLNGGAVIHFDKSIDFGKAGKLDLFTRVDKKWRSVKMEDDGTLTPKFTVDYSKGIFKFNLNHQSDYKIIGNIKKS